MSRCRICGRYNDIFEWSPEERENYKPHLCFECYQESLTAPEEPDEDTEQEEMEESTSEVDDAPDIQSSEEENLNENNSMEEENNDQESEPLSDEASRIQNIRRMLFG